MKTGTDWHNVEPKNADCSIIFFNPNFISTFEFLELFDELFERELIHHKTIIASTFFGSYTWSDTNGWEERR